MLSPNATKSYSATRPTTEPESPLRNPFQRDRDRIIHTKTFRRLKHKSQVLIAPQGDHYTTRMTHVLEVAQVGRTLARALNLNEDLVEAAALGHDLGHTPFGHIGEDVLNQLLKAGFHHSRHSVRIVTKLECDGKGLNLTNEVVSAIEQHSKPPGEFNTYQSVIGMTLEAQIVRMADAVAYLAHDIRDGIRSEWIAAKDLPRAARQILGDTHSGRIDTIVCDIVRSSKDCLHTDVPRPWIRMSADMKRVVEELRDFMFANFYHRVSNGEQGLQAQKIVRLIYDHLTANHDQIPDSFKTVGGTPNPLAAADFLCGMTDNYAMAFAEKLQPGISKGLAWPF